MISIKSQNQKEFTGADFCFHLAGIGDIVPSIEVPLKYMETNVHGTTKVLEACRNNGAICSVVSCYGLADTPTKNIQ